MYWDGSPYPSVCTPIGDFFGVGHASAVHYVSLPMSMVFGPRRGPKGPFAAAMNCYFPMPFRTGARIVLRNESDKPVENFFYDVDYELTDEPAPDDLGLFHAYYRQERPIEKVEHTTEEEHPNPWDLPGTNITGEENYVILDTEGTGQYVGCLLNIDNFNASNQAYTWPGEGDDMFFIDGESWPPSLHGTGTGDYFNAAWGFPSGAYTGPDHGISLAASVQEHFGTWSMYRFHIEDPVRFTTSLRFSIEHGHANDQHNDYSSVAYWYQTEQTSTTTGGARIRDCAIWSAPTAGSSPAERRSSLLCGRALQRAGRLQWGHARSFSSFMAVSTLRARS